MMYLLLLIVSVAAAVAAIPAAPKSNHAQEWELFKLKYRKAYSHVIDAQRKEIFKNNLKTIEAHNKRYSLEIVKRKPDPQFTYKLGLTAFSDLLESEFLKRYSFSGDQKLNVDEKICESSSRQGIATVDKVKGNGKKKKQVCKPIATPHVPTARSSGRIPDAMNWTQTFPQGPAFDQGNCSISWVLSTVGAVEYHLAKNNSYRFQKYSEQDIIDCLKGPGGKKRGCSGGSPQDAFRYMIEKGLTPAQIYPNVFPLKQGLLCYEPRVVHKPKIYEYKYYSPRNPDEEELKKIIALKGPVVASIVVTEKMRNYNEKSGVFYDNACKTNGNAKQNVIIVGYGKESGRDYWLVRTAFGINWGYVGYLKLARNQNNHCKVASTVFYPVVKKEKERKQ